MSRAAISWSGGKDSMLALLRAREAGWIADSFFTMCEPDGSSKSHLLPPQVVEAQVQALGGRWWPVRVQPGGYAAAFDSTLQALREAGHTAVVFGDIDLQAHRDWIEPRCVAAGLQALFPLWRTPRGAVASEILRRGIRARLVCADARWLDASFAGAAYDETLLARLPAAVCPCGEGGEFHTVVWDAPGFVAPLVLQPGRVREVASVPPLAATTLWVCTPELA
jgi:diphthine-ammonia ligase